MPKQISLKKNTIANYIGQFYTMFIGIFMLPFYLEYLGAEAYGLVGFFTMLSAWMMLLDMGLASTLSRETAILKDKLHGLIELKQLVRSIEVVFFAFGFIIFITILFMSGWISQSWLKSDELSLDTIESCIQIMGLMIGIRWFVGLYSGNIVGFEQQIWLNSYKISIATLKFVGAFLFILFISHEILYFFFFQAIVSVIELLVIRYKVYNLLPKTNFVKPSFQVLTKIAPFAVSIAYTSGIWIIFTQLDKLLLSHYIPLKEYGYFALVVVISSAITQLSTPFSQAILPRMTSLFSNNRIDEMYSLYHRGTQFVSILIFSVSGMVAFFSYELLFAWTGNIEASLWASPILFWYALGNGILAVLGLQYNLQYVYGNLKYHVKFNTIFPLIALPIMYYAVVVHGPIGAGIAWFMIQISSFFIWPQIVHKIFAPNIHVKWLVNDIFPAFGMSVLFFCVLKFINLTFDSLSRIEIFIILIFIGISLLILNALSYRNIREFLYIKFRKYDEESK